VGFGRPARARSFARGDDQAMRILVLADLRGDAERTGMPLATRAPQRVDVDNLANVLRAFAPRLGDLEFRDLDDFHPDTLHAKLPVFEALRDVRARLRNPTTSAAACAELQGLVRVPAAAPAPPPPGGTTATEGGDVVLFERLLGRPSTSPDAAARSAINALIRQVVAPHVVPSADPQAPQMLAAVDEATSEHMRRILRDPGFQALEAAWRAVHWLVTNLETDETLQVHLLDVSKAELALDVASAGDDLERSALYRLLMQHGPGMPDGPVWSVLAGDYRFGAGADDVALLAALGAIGAQVGGPFLAEADASILGCRSLTETPDDRRWERLDEETAARWRALRQSKAAPWLGLALPRVLLRVPYGRNSDPIEQFAFEEMPGGAYLWGSPAIACALLLGQAYTDGGTGMTPGDRQELLDLPCYTTGETGARVMTPCAEVALSERTANAILERGLMPALSFTNRNAVRIARFQSLADPPAGLSGPWG
jgi:type VI secretion system protein ImpC